MSSSPAPFSQGWVFLRSHRQKEFVKYFARLRKVSLFLFENDQSADPITLVDVHGSSISMIATDDSTTNSDKMVSIDTLSGETYLMRVNMQELESWTSRLKDVASKPLDLEEGCWLEKMGRNGRRWQLRWVRVNENEIQIFQHAVNRAGAPEKVILVGKAQILFDESDINARTFIVRTMDGGKLQTRKFRALSADIAKRWVDRLSEKAASGPPPRSPLTLSSSMSMLSPSSPRGVAGENGNPDDVELLKMELRKEKSARVGLENTVSQMSNRMEFMETQLNELKKKFQQFMQKSSRESVRSSRASYADDNRSSRRSSSRPELVGSVSPTEDSRYSHSVRSPQSVSKSHRSLAKSSKSAVSMVSSQRGPSTYTSRATSLTRESSLAKISVQDPEAVMDVVATSLQQGLPLVRCLDRSNTQCILIKGKPVSLQSETPFLSYEGSGDPYTLEQVLHCVLCFDAGYMDYLAHCKKRNVERVMLSDRGQILDDLLGEDVDEDSLEQAMSDFIDDVQQC